MPTAMVARLFGGGGAAVSGGGIFETRPGVWQVKVVVGVAAFTVAFVVNVVLLQAAPGSAWAVLDRPNERSLHKTAVPRTGGLGILMGALPWMVWIGAGSVRPIALWGLSAATFGVGLISFLDDRGGVSVGARLLAHVVAAGLLVGLGFRLAPAVGVPWESAALGLVSLGSLVWGINLYNFMDGMDGFAGGMAVIGFSMLAAFGVHAGQTAFAEVNVAVAGAALGFLVFNFPPARIFMGDVGSAPLGLLMVADTFWGVRIGCFPLWAPLVVFSPFWVDASVTLVRRLLRGERVWQAHRSHYYQRLVQLGWGHRRTVLAEYALMLLAAVVSWVGVTRLHVVPIYILGAWAVLYALLGIAVSRLEAGAIRG